MNKDDNVIHLEHRVTEIDEVSPLCAISPRPLRDDEVWTRDINAVTCPDCLEQIKKKQKRRLYLGRLWRFFGAAS